MTTIEKPTVTIHDFTVTVDTEASGGDKFVVRLDRAGEPTLTMMCGVAQLMWVIEDKELFQGWYAQACAAKPEQVA